ncbi:MAG: CotH kinase family protein [Bacteroidia bacterium]|nr:CotH kinase family protein [Bacteroidia bacterium]
MKKILLLLFLICTYDSLFSQVVINEVCPQNGELLCDEDGDFEDWLELFNSSGAPVNLQGYFLSDKPDSLNKWSFPNVVIEPDGYLTLFASGKDRKKIINHWETVVYAEDIWKYIVPDAPVDSAWNTVNFNDFGWQQGQGGFGYGDNDDSTIILPPVHSVFIRKTFNIVDTSFISSAVLHIDYDDAFVAYVNGVEIARSNIGVTGTPVSYDELAYEEHEALFYRGERPEEWKFSEQEVKMVLKNGINVIAIQVHNISLESSDMTIIPYLSIAIKNNTAYYGTPPEWFKMGISWLHTNFKLAAEGETVYLINSSWNLTDSLSFIPIHLNHSYGKFPDGVNNMAIFGKPTPDSTNNNSIPYYSYTADPSFSVDAGFYNNGQLLTITCPTPGAKIKYTTDGSEPKDSASVYSNPIEIDTNSIIRACAFAAEALPSNAITNSYFIDYTTTLPIVSISTNPGNFWDWEHGIYVMGPNAEPEMPYFNANFWQEWEVPVHIEFFNIDGGLEFEQDFGTKVHGGWSRSLDLKSLRIIARGKYGKSRLDYNLFPDKGIPSFKQFVLRNSGNECNVTHFRDGLIHKSIHKATAVDIQDYRPSVVFLNGEFVAVLNLREKISEDYIAENHGGIPADVDLLQFDGYVINGSNEHFLQMAEFIVYNDMSLQENYDSVKTMLDINNFIDYFASETYYVNWDWPQNNVKYWRNHALETKWRYIITDVDFGLGFGGSSFATNDLNRVIHQEDNYHSFILKSLLNNIEFRNYFINR